MGHPVSMQIALWRDSLLGRSNLLSCEIVDRQKTDQRHSFLFDPCTPILLFPIHDHECLTHEEACLSSRGNRFQERSTAGQHIVDD